MTFALCMRPYCSRAAAAASRLPKVFRPGLYTIQVGEGPSRKTLRGIRALPDGATDVLRVEL
jgi:hypothetical protein